MPRKSYRQYCGVARALDVVGERWSLLIARNLLLGPRRYSDLLAELPGITTNLLAKRLRELETLEVIERQQLPPPLSVSVYRLTDAGRALEPAILALARWGGRFMDAPGRQDTVNLGWAFLFLKLRYRGGLSCTAEVHVGERRFTLGFSEAYLSVEERAADRADITLSGEPRAIVALFFQAANGAELERSAGLSVTGRRSLLRAIERAFSPPEFAVGVAQPRAMTRRKLSKRNSSVSSKRAV